MEQQPPARKLNRAQRRAIRQRMDRNHRRRTRADKRARSDDDAQDTTRRTPGRPA